MKIKEYLFEDAEFRKTANDLHFVCNVGGRMFRICLDKPGLCRATFKGFIFKKRLEEYIPAEKYQFMLDAKTECFNEEKYPF